ncbi:MAG: UDP-N-acetylmuramate--L-alanine ligase [Leptotrichiaceae bacterium]|nr:UDP-N-acetylmuramate--L-alanine ligase [Leptotrichiaceae bacterium]
MLSEIRNIYFSGINGIGMSGLAKILVKEGYNVAGSDLERKTITQEMENMGIKVNIGQTEENVKNRGIDLFVYSTAIREDNPEYRYIIKNGIKKIKRGELLAQLMNKSEGIAVAGTHGKTTTSSMMSVAFLEKDPTIVVGGIIPEIQSNSKIGNSEYFIAEADESDNSFLYINPKYSVITNVEPDHLEHHGTYENIKKSFEKFIDSTEKLTILCKDCKEISTLKIKNKNIIWYSIKREDVHIFATNITVKNGCTYFEVIKNGKNLGEFMLCIPGEHNVANSLPVIYLADEMGCNMEAVKERLGKFKGANRRYQVIYDKNLRIIDDYAHHPTEIKVTIEAARAIEKGKVTVIFQPHRYSRTKFFFNDFIESLGKADELILLPIYSAGEDNTYDVSSENLAEKIGNGVKVYTEKEIEELIKNDRNSNNSYVFMGAGSVSKLAHEIKDILK